MQNDTLTAQNAYLTKMLKQAGLDAEASIVAAEIQSVLTNEIHHRMKNMLAMVTAIVRQSVRTATSLKDAETAISTRLMAMAKAHDLLLKADLTAASLTSIVHGAIEQHNTASGRIHIAGDDIHVAPASILPLTLILNELCTNATKYGALSREDGLVTLSWSPDPQGESLVVQWAESGGPPVAPAITKGFGTRLIEEAIPRQFGGTGFLTFNPSGLEFRLTAPLDKLRAT